MRKFLHLGMDYDIVYLDRNKDNAQPLAEAVREVCHFFYVDFMFFVM